jgi:hypothetical protein
LIGLGDSPYRGAEQAIAPEIIMNAFDFPPAFQDPWHSAPAMAHSFVGAAADQSRSDRARQQDGKNCVGHDGQG